MQSHGSGPHLSSMQVCDRLPTRCRQDAPSRSMPVEHRLASSLLRHLDCAAQSISAGHHADGSVTTAKPPSPVRLRSPPPMNLLHTGTFCVALQRFVLPIRQSRRHLADEAGATEQHQGAHAKCTCVSLPCPGTLQHPSPPARRRPVGHTERPPLRRHAPAPAPLAAPRWMPGGHRLAPGGCRSAQVRDGSVATAPACRHVRGPAHDAHILSS